MEDLDTPGKKSLFFNENMKEGSTYTKSYAYSHAHGHYI